MLDQKPLKLIAVLPMFTVDVLSGLLYICTEYVYILCTELNWFPKQTCLYIYWTISEYTALSLKTPITSMKNEWDP